MARRPIDLTFAALTACLAVGVALRSIVASSAAESQPELENLLAKMHAAADHQRSSLCSYSVIQQYTLQNKHLDPSAEMRVWLTYKRGQGKHAQILSMQANGVARRSLQNLVAEEVRDRTSKQDNNAVDSTNYQFRLLGEDSCGNQHCYKLSITPRHKRKDLVDGTAWVSGEDYHLVKITGLLSKSPSFWISEPKVQEFFERVNGFSLPSYNHSTTQVVFLGEANLTIEYSDYHLQACKD